MKPGIIQQKGFVWLELPREGLQPLTLLENNDNVFRRISAKIFNTALTADALNADVFSLFPKPKSGLVPKISGRKEVEFFKGFDILDVASNLSLKTMKKVPLLGAVEASQNLKLATKLLYAFNDVKRRFTNEILLEEHLNISKPESSKSGGFIDKLKSGRIFIVSEVLETRNFSVEDASDYSIEGNINVDAVKEYLELKSSLAANKENKKIEGYNNNVPITFALKAFKIIYNEEKDNYSLSKTPIKIVRGDDKIEKEAIPTESGFLQID